MMEVGGRRLITQGNIRALIKWTGLGLLILIAAASLGSVALHAYGVHRLEIARSRFEAEWGRLTSHELPTPVPEHENGARWLMAGGTAIIYSIEDQKLVGRKSGVSAREWTDFEQGRARWILHEQQNALGILLRSGSFRNFHLGTNDFRTNHDEIDFISIIKGLRLLTLEARLAWIEGRVSDSLAAVMAVSRAADGLLRTPVVMTSTLGSAAVRWAASASADLVSDPCTTIEALEELSALLPTEDPIRCGNITLAMAVTEIADEGLDYTGDTHDPSLGWSIPFWVSNRYLLEDLFVAQIIERWGRFLEIGQQPAAHWPPDQGTAIWGEAGWHPWLALTGSYTPNLLNDRVRTQAASTELQQLRVALDLRLSHPELNDSKACDLVNGGPPTALTGEPVTCRVDRTRGVITIVAPLAEQTLSTFVAQDNHASRLPAIELTMGGAGVDCPPPSPEVN